MENQQQDERSEDNGLHSMTMLADDEPKLQRITKQDAEKEQQDAYQNPFKQSVQQRN